MSVIEQVASILELTQRPHQWSQEALNTKLPYYPNYEVLERLKGNRNDPNCPFRYNHQTWTWDPTNPDDKRVKTFYDFCSSLQWGVEIYDKDNLPQKEGDVGAIWNHNLKGTRTQYKLNYHWYFENLALVLSDKENWSDKCYWILKANGRDRKDYVEFTQELLKIYEKLTENKICIIPSGCQVKKEDIDVFLKYIRSNI